MPRKEKKYHFIYKTTNILTGYYYYGMHSTDDLNDGYLGSGRRLRYAINKYGKKWFKREIIEFCKDRKELSEREKEIVNLNEIAKKHCINIKVGGEGGWTLEQRRNAQIKSTKKQRWLRENNKEWKERVSKNMSVAFKNGYKNGTRMPNMPNWAGKKHKEETKRKISKANSISQKGERNSQYGIKRFGINKDGIIKRVKEGELEEYLKLGWKRGNN